MKKAALKTAAALGLVSGFWNFVPEARAIVSGVDVQYGDPIASSAVLLSIGAMGQDGQVCTGTLIAPHFVLTAAHCVVWGADPSKKVSPSDITLAFGNARAFWSVPDPITIKSAIATASAVLIHEGYRGLKADPSDDNDIALIRFEDALPDELVPAAILPREADRQIAIGMKTTIAGFGWTQTESRENFSTLQRGETSISQLKGHSVELRGASEICQGDSGGPAFVTLNGRAYLWAIHSMAEGHCSLGSQELDLRFYEDWINRQLGDAHIHLFSGL